MVTPDAVVGGYLDFVVARLHAHGFEVRGCRLIALDYPRLARMYHHRDDPPPPSGSRMELPETVMTPLYRLSPACVLVVRKAGDAACQDLLRCKGATRPEAAAPDTVRAAGEHIIFNFAHCPDDAPSATIELAYLVGAGDAAALQDAACATAAPPTSPLNGLSQLRLCLPAFSGWEVLSFPSIASRIRCRVVQALALRLGADARGSLLEAQTLLTRERDALLGAASVADRLRLAQAAHPGIHAALTTAARAAGDAGLADGLAALAALYDLEGSRELAPVLALADQGIYLSELEKVALDAHRHAFWSDEPPSERRIAGERDFDGLADRLGGDSASV